MDINVFSKEYVVKKLEKDDIPEIYNLCSKNKLYYDYRPPYVTEQSIEADMKAVPLGKTISDKFYVGYFNGDKLVAILDLICRYPNPKAAYIGFFMVDADSQKQGIGSDIISKLSTVLVDNGFNTIQLAWVYGNPQAEAFWTKNGFVKFGDVCELKNYSVIRAKKEI
jgi:GNAT superfamily N-acetyltransferase